MKSGVALHGGFAGTETMRDQRNWQTNLTVLSGDIDGNDTTDPSGVVMEPNNIHDSNAYHVLDGSGTDTTAILDGFTVTAGKATGGGYHDRGGGMVISSGSLAVQNVCFIGNLAWDSGGGMIIAQGAPEMTTVTLSGNWASGYGGGIYLNVWVSPLKMVNCILWGNDGSNGSLVHKQIWVNSGEVQATYSDIQGASVYPGAGNINADPQFTAPIAATVAPTTTGDYHLQMTSPAIDAGNNFSVTVSTDLDGKARRVDVLGVPDTGADTPPIVDLGAYETRVPPDLGISVTDGKSYAVAGDPITYTVVVTNAGQDTATGAVVTDTLPGTISNVTWTCVASGGSCGALSGSGNLSTTVNLDAGGAITFTIGGRLSPGANGTLIKTAYVSHPTDPNLDNNSATDIDIVLYIKVYIPLVVKWQSISRFKEGGSVVRAQARLARSSALMQRDLASPAAVAELRTNSDIGIASFRDDTGLASKPK